jgi:cell wall-associated NlpC family hydrolase
LEAALTDALPDDFSLDLRAVTPLRTGEWHTLVGGVSAVWQRHPSRGLSLSTELLPSDGPVELLAVHDGARLVRVMDGTVGWVERELGGRRSAPTIAPAHGTGDQVVTSSRALLDTPYRLGGTTLGGVDCSGLCQRAYREGLGVLLPRHSMDQLNATLRMESSPRQSGDLVFVWSEREGPCHVGVLTHDTTTSVVHASLSRKRVVEDPWERFIEQTSRIEVVAVARALEYHATNVGLACLSLSDRWDEA